MIAKKFRITEPEVKRVLKKWRPFFTSLGTCIIFPNTKQYNRCGFVVSRKNAKMAVTRNYFRRNFYDAFLGVLEQDILGSDRHYDCMFVSKKSWKMDHKNADQLDEFLDRISFLKKKLKSLDYSDLGRKVRK